MWCVLAVFTVPSVSPLSLQVHFHPAVGVSVSELTEAAVSSIEDVLRLVDYGAKMRTVRRARRGRQYSPEAACPCEALLYEDTSVLALLLGLAA